MLIRTILEALGFAVLIAAIFNEYKLVELEEKMIEKIKKQIRKIRRCEEW